MLTEDGPRVLRSGGHTRGPTTQLCVAVIGVPDEKWGETVRAIITVAPGSDPSEDELIDYCRERLAHFKCPTSVDRIDLIPRNPAGKILKTELRKPHWEGKDRSVN